LGLTTGAAVSLQRKQLQTAPDHDPDLRKQMVTLEQAIQRRLLPEEND
jgi:hypothetical protein